MKLVYMLGKSASGKDTVYKKLREDYGDVLCPMIPYTTRPMREGEKEGDQYHFITMEQSDELERQGKVIEKRVYQTVFGPWKYLTIDEGQMRTDGAYLMIGTLQSYRKMVQCFGEEQIVPILIELDDGIRLQRALDREKMQKHPNYQELCRRYLADDEDFSEEKLKEAGVGKRFYNDDLERCLTDIRAYIEERR